MNNGGKVLLSMKKYRSATLLILMFAFGLTVRLWGINFGLPEPYHLEEPFYTRAAYNLACEGNADSAILQSHTYLQATVITIVDLARGDSICNSEFDEVLATLILQSRLISAIAGATTILIVFWLGKELFGEGTGLIGAIFLTFNFLHVRDSHFGTPDLVSAFLITSSLVFYARILKGHPGKSNYLLATVFTALSVNARPTAILLIIPFFYSHAVAVLGEGRIMPKNLLRVVFDRRFIIALVLFGIFLLLLHPQLWINPIEFGKYWMNFLALGAQGGFGRLRVDTLSAPLYYLRSIVWAFGYLLTMLIGFGLGVSIFTHRRSDTLLLGFVIPYILVASSSTVYFARYIIPVLPFLSIIASRGLDMIWRDKHWAFAKGSIVVLLLVQPIIQIGRLDYLLCQEDTRTLAVAWIDSHIQKSSKIASEWHGPPIKGFQLDTVDFYGLSEMPVEYYRENAYDYLIVSSFIRDAVMVDAAEEAKKKRFYQELEESSKMVKAFSPVIGNSQPAYVIDQVLGPIDHLFQYERPGPEIRIYQLAN
jgi:4-amino-4-deoxy-L-arabinose transferase-like glycosyltransferase